MTDYAISRAGAAPRLAAAALAVASVFCAQAAMAAGGGIGLLSAGADLGDRASLQRGARTYMNYCHGCHSLDYVRYNRIGRDLDLTDAQVAENLVPPGRAVVDEMKIAMRGGDAERWFGVKPPDLSVTARSRGPDWIYSYLLTFYQDDDPARPFGVNNVVYDGAAMPHALWPLQGHQRYVAAKLPEDFQSVHPTRLQAMGDTIRVHKEVLLEDGSHVSVTDTLEVAAPGEMAPGEYRRSVRDLVNFLTYAAEPAKLSRYTIGFWVVVFLLGFLALSRALYKEYWRDVAH